MQSVQEIHLELNDLKTRKIFQWVHPLKWRYRLIRRTRNTNSFLGSDEPNRKSGREQMMMHYLKTHLPKYNRGHILPWRHYVYSHITSHNDSYSSYFWLIIYESDILFNSFKISNPRQHKFTLIKKNIREHEIFFSKNFKISKFSFRKNVE